MKLFKNFLAPLFLILIFFLYFWKIFIHNLIPFPGDMLVGAYYPWLDYKWGYSVGVPIKNPLISDVFSQFFIWKSIIVESFSRLQWPLWNIYSYSGYPLLANFHSGAFNPINFLMLLFGNSNGWTYMVLSQSLLSSLTMYLLLRYFKLSKISSLAGAIIYSYSSFLVTWSQFVTAGYSMIYLPLLLLFLDKFLSTGRLKNIIPIPLIIVLLITSGHLQSIIYSLLVAIFYVLYKQRLNLPTKNVFILFSILFLSFGLASAQILPTLELSNYSIRFSENYIANINYGLLPPSNFITLFSPDYFGNPATHNFYGFFNYHETVIYLGLLFTVSLVWSIYNFKYLKKIHFFILGYLVCLLLIFDNPISRLIYQLKIPFLYTSAAGRIAFMMTFFGAFIVATFINSINKSNFKTILKSIFIILLIICSQISIILLLQKYFFSVSEYIPKWYANLDISKRNMYLPLLITLLSLSFFYFLAIINKYNFIKTLFLLVIIIDLFRFGWKYTPFVNKNFIYPTTDIINYLKSDKDIFRIDRENGPLLTPNTWAAYGLSSPSGYDPMSINDYVVNYNQTLNGNANSTAPSRYSELSKYDASKLGQFNVKYLLALKYNEIDMIYHNGDHFSYKINPQDWTKVFEHGSVAILQNSNYLPRSFILSQDNTPLKQGAKITKYSPNQVVINYHTDYDSSLILLDTWYPGWQATVNNTRTNIEKYNRVFRSVKIPRGSGTVVFNYYPKSFYLGLSISIFSFFIYLITIIYIYKNRHL